MILSAVYFLFFEMNGELCGDLEGVLIVFILSGNPDVLKLIIINP